MATKSYSRTRTLVECALMIAVGTVLAQIKIFEMPFGGSVTLVSMLPFILVSFRHGVKWGLATGFVNSLLQMLLGFYAPPAGTVAAFVGVVCWTTCWLSPCWAWRALSPSPSKNHLLGVAAGTAAVCVIRFCAAFCPARFCGAATRKATNGRGGCPFGCTALSITAATCCPNCSSPPCAPSFCAKPRRNSFCPRTRTPRQNMVYLP